MLSGALSEEVETAAGSITKLNAEARQHLREHAHGA